eukprot:31651_1
MSKNCHFKSFILGGSARMKIQCRNCMKKPNIISSSSISPNTVSTSSIDPTSASYDRIDHNQQILTQRNEQTSQRMQTMDPPPNIESTNEIDGKMYNRFVYEKNLKFEMTFETFDKIFNVDIIKLYWDTNKNKKCKLIPRDGTLMGGTDIFKDSATFIDDIIDDILRHDKKCEIFPCQPCIATMGLKGLTKGNRNVPARIHGGMYCRRDDCGILLTDINDKKTIDSKRKKLFEVYILKSDAQKSYQSKLSNKPKIPYHIKVIKSKTGASPECNHEVGAKFPYICNNKKKDFLTSTDIVSKKSAEALSKLPLNMRKAGNHRNVGSNAQLYGMKSQAKKKELGRLPGINSLHEVLNIKKQNEFENNCKIFNISEETNPDKYRSWKYAMQSLHIDPDPFSVMFDPPLDIKLLAQRYTPLYLDYTKKQIKTYGQNRYDGCIPRILQKYPGIDENWVLEVCGDPAPRDETAGGGIASYSFMITENGCSENADMLLNSMDRKSRKINGKPLIDCHPMICCDDDDALIGPVCKLYGYASRNKYVRHRWFEDCNFLLSKQIPFVKLCWNHSAPNFIRRAEKNIEVGTSRRTRTILKVSELRFFQNLQNRPYINKQYAIVEQTALCQGRELLLLNQQLPFMNGQIIITPNDVRGRDSYLNYEKK